jgi:hypothetical protein
MLRIGFTLPPIVMGSGQVLQQLRQLGAAPRPLIWNIGPGSAVHAMHVVGIIEIVTGVLVALKSRYAAYLGAA